MGSDPIIKITRTQNIRQSAGSAEPMSIFNARYGTADAVASKPKAPRAAPQSKAKAKDPMWGTLLHDF